MKIRNQAKWFRIILTSPNYMWLRFRRWRRYFYFFAKYLRNHDSINIATICKTMMKSFLVLQKLCRLRNVVVVLRFLSQMFCKK